MTRGRPDLVVRLGGNIDAADIVVGGEALRMHCFGVLDHRHCFRV